MNNNDRRNSEPPKATSHEHQIMTNGSMDGRIRRRSILKGVTGAAMVSLGGCISGDTGGQTGQTATGPLAHLPRLPQDAEWSQEFTGECVAGFSHYITDATRLDKIIGPVYLGVGDRVVGVGYMLTKGRLDEMATITPDGIEREFLSSGDLPIEYEIDHITVSYIEHGHVGFQEPHWDVHQWLISPDMKEDQKIDSGSSA